MRGTVSKKIRQLYRREYRDRVLEEQGFLQRVLKPPPYWLPFFLWRWLGRIYFTELPSLKNWKFKV